MITVEDAIILAATLHKGQVDKQGVPYILHPLRVMLAVPARLKTAAVLHDVLEDCDISSNELADQIDDPQSMTIIELLTHRRHEPREIYVRHLCECPDAVQIKLADLRDNLGRTVGLPDGTRLITKYGKDIAVIADCGYDTRTGERKLRVRT